MQRGCQKGLSRGAPAKGCAYAPGARRCRFEWRNDCAGPHRLQVITDGAIASAIESVTLVKKRETLHRTQVRRGHRGGEARPVRGDPLGDDWIAAELRKTSGIDVSNDKIALQRLRESAEKAKMSSRVRKRLPSTTSINLPFLTVAASGPVHLDLRLSRAKLEQLMTPLIERTIRPVTKALADAKKTPAGIEEIVLVGGSTRIPMVKDTVKKFFGNDPHQGVNPDEVVAIGAAVQAGVLSGDVKDMVLLDVTPLSLRIETLGGVAEKTK